MAVAKKKARKKSTGVSGKVKISAKKKASIAKVAGNAAMKAASAAVRKSLSGIK